MALRYTVGLFAAASGLFVAGSAFASTKKSSNSATISGSVPKSRTLVAMSGSGSLSSSSSSGTAYVGLSLFPFTYQGTKETVKNTTTETPTTTISTMSKSLEFYGRRGAWTLRPTLSLEANRPNIVALGYNLSSNLEVGGFVSYSRTSATTTAADGKKTDGVASSIIVGPQAFYFTEVANFPIEAELNLGLISSTAESTTGGTTTKTVDQSGYVFAAGAKLIREVNSQMEFFAGASLGYSSVTDKSNKDAEKTTSGINLTILPAGVRFMF